MSVNEFDYQVNTDPTADLYVNGWLASHSLCVRVNLVATHILQLEKTLSFIFTLILNLDLCLRQATLPNQKVSNLTSQVPEEWRGILPDPSVVVNDDEKILVRVTELCSAVEYIFLFQGESDFNN